MTAMLLAAVPLTAQPQDHPSPSGGQASVASVGADHAKPPAGGWANPACDQPQSLGEAVLCVQQRTAKATQDLVIAVMVLIGLAGVGAVLLLWGLHSIRRAMLATVAAPTSDSRTLDSVREAAQAAAAAAKAASDSLNSLREPQMAAGAAATADTAGVNALADLERAYLFIEINPRSPAAVEAVLSEYAAAFRRRRPLQLLAPSFEYHIVNHGKTPAVIRKLQVSLSHAADVPTALARVDATATEIVLKSEGIHPRSAPSRTPGADEAGAQYRGAAQYELNREGAEAILAGTSYLWLHGIALYEDIFRREHETAFCWRYGGVPPTFEPYGGVERNYRT